MQHARRHCHARQALALRLAAAGDPTNCCCSSFQWPHLAVVCLWLLPQLLHRQLHAADNQGPECIAAEERDICSHVVGGLCGCVSGQKQQQQHGQPAQELLSDPGWFRGGPAGHKDVAANRLTLMSASIMRFADVARRCMWELSLNTRLPRTVRAVVYAPLGAVASHCPDVTSQGTTWLLWTRTTGAVPTAVLLPCA